MSESDDSDECPVKRARLCEKLSSSQLEDSTTMEQCSYCYQSFFTVVKKEETQTADMAEFETSMVVDDMPECDTATVVDDAPKTSKTEKTTRTIFRTIKVKLNSFIKGWNGEILKETRQSNVSTNSSTWVENNKSFGLHFVLNSIPKKLWAHGHLKGKKSDVQNILKERASWRADDPKILHERAKAIHLTINFVVRLINQLAAEAWLVANYDIVRRLGSNVALDAPTCQYFELIMKLLTWNHHKDIDPRTGLPRVNNRIFIH
jgi:hypothetical protein